LIGAPALGFAAQWLTGWAAYDTQAAALFGLAENECVVGFVHIGTAQEPTPERTRPLLADVVSEWHA
jgi:nitroreductase